MRPDPLIISEGVTATGAKAAVRNDTGAKFFTIQVKGRAAGATAWTVDVQGSLNGTEWTTIVSHGTADADGTVKNSGATPWPVLYIRINTTALTIGSAAVLDIKVNGLP